MIRNACRAAARIQRYRLSRALGLVPPLPLSIALSVTNRCQSRCRTCNIWRVGREQPERIRDELTAEEWERILSSLGKGPLWFTITGGEPFLRNDILGIVSHIARHNRPRYLNIATSGLYPEKTAACVEEMLATLTGMDTMLTINISVDEVGRQYDSLRGVPLGFRSVERTFQLLREVKSRHPGLIIGTNIVLSKHNERRFVDIYAHIREHLRPDSLVCELGGAREAFSFREDIAAGPDATVQALRSLVKGMNQSREAAVTRLFRNAYYRLMEEQLARAGQAIPCYAGYASCEISPTGELWGCSVRANPMGDLRQHAYDFRKAWRSAQARNVRESIRRERCSCTGANPSYTSLLCAPAALARFLVSR